jgi:hypothetical protein
MMPTVGYISRDKWNARKPRSITPLVLSRQKGTAVHYSAGLGDSRANHAECFSVVQGIQRFHMDGRGWADIAYSFLVCIHGGIFVGRGRGVRTAANGTNAGNAEYHAVCFLGGDRAGRADVTEEGKAAIRRAVLDCNDWADVNRVVPHSSFKPTECPGNELRAWISAGMPVQEDELPTIDDIDKYLASPRGQSRLEKAVDTLMSLGLTGDKGGAIRGWAVRLENVERDVAEILQLLKNPPS